MWGLQTWPHVSLKPWAATRPTTVLRQWLTSLMVNPIHPPSAHTTVREVVNAERGGNGWLNIWQLQSAQALIFGWWITAFIPATGCWYIHCTEKLVSGWGWWENNKQHSQESHVRRRLWTKQKTWWSKVATCNSAHHHLPAIHWAPGIQNY